jgi:hypothetical protein
LVVANFIGALIVTLVTSIVLIILGVIYFAITLVIINGAAGLVFGVSPGVDWAIASAALLSTGAIIAGALEKKS